MDERLRMICLFAYETMGGRDALLWTNPSYFSNPGGQGGKELDEKLDAWRQQKRSFTREEVLRGRWIKIGENGFSFSVQFREDGTLVETRLFQPFGTLEGRWELVGTVLRMRVLNYELDVFASRCDDIHFGIEVEGNQPKPNAVFRVLQLRQ